MILPLTRIWFNQDRVQYRFSHEQPVNERYVFAEYHLLQKKLVWKEWTQKQEQKNLKVVKNVIGLGSLFSVPIIMMLNHYMRRYTYIKATPQERLGELWLLTPIVFGIVLFLVFDCYLLTIRQRATIVAGPEQQSENEYFNRVIDIIPFNSRKVVIPWLVIGGMSSVLFAVILLTVWLYNQRETYLTFITQLSILSILVAVLVFFLWQMLGRYIVIKKIVQSERKK